MKLDKKYLIAFFILLITEIAIAVFHFHDFIRGFVGDVLVVPLLYCFIKSFLKIRVVKAVVLVLLVAFGVEIVQYFQIFNTVDSVIVRTLVGSHFDWLDFIAYGIGGALILIVDGKNEVIQPS